MNNWLAMGGYGIYVWGSLAAVVACLLIELIVLRMRFKSATNQK